MSGLLFLALLMVMVSGLIAYIGDLIGRKMGRKRLTLFGLRPRHTAIVISVFAGMLIAVFTFAAAFIVSKPVRLAIFVPREVLQKENDDLQKENDNLNVRLTQERRSLAEAEEQRTEAEKLMRDSQQQLADVGKELATRQKLIDEKKKQLAKVEKDLEDSRTELNETRKKLTSEGRRLADLMEQHKNLKGELDELQKAVNPFMIANFSPLAFASGQEISSGLLPAKGSSAALRRERLRLFLNDARQIVHGQSDLPADNAIVFLRVEGETVSKLTDIQTINLLSDRLARITEAKDAIVRLAPANNVSVGGQAFVIVNEAPDTNAAKVQVIPNTQVYTAGDEVARLELTVTQQLTTGEIFTRLVDDLLRENVPNALRKKEVLLILRRFDPSRPIGIPGASTSLVSWSDLASAAEQVRRLSGKVSVVARSNKTMNRFDPLSLSLEVKGSD